MLQTIFGGPVPHSNRCASETLDKCTCHRLTVDCSNAGLTDVPGNLPENIRRLILDGNHISTLRNNSFVGRFNNLKLLRIRGNSLQRLEASTFHDMTSLKMLDLYNNSLEKNNSLPTTVFVPISKTLKVLDIRMNLISDNATNYPTAVVSLKSLTILKMDCLHQTPLPTDFGKLQNLKSLVFGGGRSDSIHLATTMFDAVSMLNITEINLVKTIGYLDRTTLPKVKTLQSLDLSNNPLLGNILTEVISGLNETAIQRLRLNNTNIGDDASEVIKRMCDFGIKELTIDHNSIYEIETILKKCIPDVEILSFGENYLYERSDLIWDIYHLDNLVGLNISWQQRENSKIFSPAQRRAHHFETQIFSMNQESFQINKHKVHLCQTGTACPIILPPKMEWVDMSHYGLHLPDVPELVLLQNSTLRSVNIAFSGVQFMKKPTFCPVGPWHIVPQIEHFDASYNALQCMTASYFDKNVTHCDWRSLKYLYLGSNKLGEIEGNICNEDKHNILGFLQPLTSLKVLDLSMNGIGTGLRYNDMRTLKSIEHLDLSFNNFVKWSLNIESMTKLDLVDLSHNNLLCLSRSASRSLDRLQLHRNKSGSISIDMTGNLLSCSCECLEFFQWVEKTRVDVVHYRNYSCIFKNGDIWQLNRLHTLVARLESECYSTLWLDLYISLVLLIYTSISILTVTYRVRHEIKYVWIKMKMNRERLERLFSSNKSKYTFDAFVSCEHRDARLFVHRHLLPNLETKNKGLTASWLKRRNQELRPLAADHAQNKRNPQSSDEPNIDDDAKNTDVPDLSFCIAQRDFIVGATIIHNIVKRMAESRKVIMIVSKYFMSSDWCKEEIRIAHQVREV